MKNTNIGEIIIETNIFKMFKEIERIQKNNISSVIQLNNIYRFRNMIRWAGITRIRKVSWLRINFSGTVGKIDGQYNTRNRRGYPNIWSLSEL